MSSGTETTAIDPNGDVIFELKGARLLVCSRILILVSPVFEAMFKPRFKEGIELDQKRSGEKQTVALPDDDAQAMTILCRIIHHRAYEINSSITLETLEMLAEVCDKYQCTKALIYYNNENFSRLSKTIESTDALYRLLLVAYSMDCPWHFADISEKIMWQVTGQFMLNPTGLEVSSARHDLSCKISPYILRNITHSE